MSAFSKVCKIDCDLYISLCGKAAAIKIVFIGNNIRSTNSQCGSSRVGRIIGGTVDCSNRSGHINRPSSGCGFGLHLPVAASVSTNNRYNVRAFSKICKIDCDLYISLCGKAAAIKIVFIGNNIRSTNSQCGSSRVGWIIGSSGDCSSRRGRVHCPGCGCGIFFCLPVPGRVFTDH